MNRGVFRRAKNMDLKDRIETDHGVTWTMVNGDDKERVVRIINKKGRTIITCSCQNHARFADNNELTLCKHKIRAIQEENDI